MAEPHTGAMVALIPSDEDLKRLSIEGGEDADELHCTLLYLGDAAGIDEDTRLLISAKTANIAVDYEPFDADGFGISLFNPQSDEPCVVLVLSGADLAGLHHELAGEVDAAPAQHQPWIPHITLAYDPDPSMVGELRGLTGPVVFDRLRVAFAGEHVDYPLGAAVEQPVAARRPYPGQKWRHGWIPTTYAIAVRWHKNLDGLHDLIDAVESGEAESEQLSGGSQGVVHRVTHNNGKVSIRKRLEDVSDTMGHKMGTPRRQADAEQLVGRLGQAIGAPTVKVLRTEDDEVHMDFAGRTASGLTMEQIADAVETPEGIRLGALDVMTANFDRQSPDNWSITADGTPVGFDHSLAFWDGSDPQDPPVKDAMGPFALNFVRFGPGGTTEWDDNPLSEADIAFLRLRLADLEDDFDRLGRHDWWEFASARLEAIAAHATGTESRFVQ